jgi:uncharacterized protein YegP (UPF0339 family)
MHLELFQDKNDDWRMRLKATNGEVLLSSEAYSSRGQLNDTISGMANALGDGAARLPVVVADKDDPDKREFHSLADWMPR